MKKAVILIIFVLLVWVFFVRPPVSGGQLTSIFGPRYFADRSFHTGSDIALPVGSPVNSISWGTVERTGYNERAGLYIRIAHLPGIISRYYHLDSINVTAGQRVNPSMLIGTVGNTGISTGSHLHLEIRAFGVPLPAYTLIFPGRLLDKAGVYRFFSSGKEKILPAQPAQTENQNA
ncbi:MAG: M23 family metallopeptidase [Spirochaetaceae bacterium]|nr:M23 family metallopeptidase [Spirochaetaceae bacterium]